MGYDFLSAQDLADQIPSIAASDMALALELKEILDDLTLAQSAAGVGPGPLTPADNNVDSIKSAVNPDAFKVTHMTTGHSMWVPGTILNFTDKFSPSYNKEMVYGRMDPIATYAHTTRSITFDWEIDTAGGSNTYALGAIGDIIKFMYPFYERESGDNFTLKGAPTLKFAFRNLFGQPNTIYTRGSEPVPGAEMHAMVCIVDDFTITGIDNTSQGANTIYVPGDTTDRLVAQVYTLSFALTPIHSHAVVGWRMAEGESAHRGVPSFGQGDQYPYGFGTVLGTTAEEQSGDSSATNNRTASDSEQLSAQQAAQNVLGQSPGWGSSLASDALRDTAAVGND
tara:strand:+ start:487 stop:1503 length:1017 start_codon:yes stop_codon:yes gene_type:complete